MQDEIEIVEARCRNKILNQEKYFQDWIREEHLEEISSEQQDGYSKVEKLVSKWKIVQHRRKNKLDSKSRHRVEKASNEKQEARTLTIKKYQRMRKR